MDGTKFHRRKELINRAISRSREIESAWKLTLHHFGGSTWKSLLFFFETTIDGRTPIELCLIGKSNIIIRFFDDP